MLFDTHSTANLLPFSILKKNQVFRKTHQFFQKILNLDRFEKSYYFSRILRQTCNNLVKKFSRSETWTNIVNAVGKLRDRQKWTIWEEAFAFIILKKMAQNNFFAFYLHLSTCVSIATAWKILFFPKFPNRE